MILTITRDSVSAGDDILSPHRKRMKFGREIKLDEIIEKIINNGYIPKFDGKSNWTILINGKTIGDVYFHNDNYKISLKLTKKEEMKEIHFQYN